MKILVEFLVFACRQVGYSVQWRMVRDGVAIAPQAGELEVTDRHGAVFVVTVRAK